MKRRYRIKDNDLRPCPFCGHSANIREGRDVISIGCDKCCIYTRSVFFYDTKSVSAIVYTWNRRVDK